MRDQGALDAESVLRLTAGLAEGLAAIHAAGVIHRDLKPSNVLLAADGPRIIDFGISRPMDAGDLTSTGNILCSPGFMSPEQAEGLPVGPSTDIFSLGAVLTFAATGDGPFGSARNTVLLYRRQPSAPPAGEQPATNARVFGGPVMIDSPGYPIHVNQPEPVQAPPAPPAPPPVQLPILVPAAPTKPKRKHGWLAYYMVAAVLIVAAGVMLGVHIASHGSALPERVPGASTTLATSVSSPARPDPAAVVRAYYKAINNGNFAKAWALGGKNLGQNFATFVAGFAQDTNVGIMSLTATGNTVTAKTQAVEFDGETEVLNLTYTIVNGVITAVSEHTS